MGERPLPRPSPWSQPYWESARQGRLSAPRCRACGHLFLPPRPLCPRCRGEAFDWVPLSGRGRVYSFTVVRQPAHPAFAERVPYVFAVVELEEGPWLVANILDCPPEAVQVGMPVEVTFEEPAPGVALPQFRPAPPS